MSAGSIRRQLAADAAAAAARVSEAKSAAVAHRHNLDPHDALAQAGHGHRGQFRGYVFRTVRAPAPPPPRRPTPLRRRPPSPPGAGAAGPDHEEHANAPPLPSMPGFAAAEQAERAPGLDLGPLTRHDDPGEREQDDRREEARHDRRWRIGARSAPPSGAASASAGAWQSAFEALAGANARALAPASPDAIAAASPEYRAMALVGALLELEAAAAGRGAPTAPGGPAGLVTQLAALRLVAVRAYLQSRPEPGPLATLARVKQALLDQRSEPGPRVAAPTDPAASADPAEEARQNRHALLPLLLLNADRPRTPQQTRLSCDRIEMVCATSMAAPAA
jgi:hypothetical protein